MDAYLLRSTRQNLLSQFSASVFRMFVRLFTLAVPCRISQVFQLFHAALEARLTYEERLRLIRGE